MNVLDAMRSLDKPCCGLMITTDKVYENKENGEPFNEGDPLGGFDPYSASKAAAEMAIASFRNAYFPPESIATHQKSIVALRAGNVIGGGDYSDDRIIPDIIRSIEREETVKLRNPKAIRPWQHVLEPLFAYLLVAAKMAESPQALAPAYNIGPDKQDVLDVETVTKKFIQYFGKGDYEIVGNARQPHEAQTLVLNNDKIKHGIGWVPKYNADDALRLTASWYADKEKTASEKTIEQINNYLAS
jgi:CDP-glucose 4,6-dehydratase